MFGCDTSSNTSPSYSSLPLRGLWAAGMSVATAFVVVAHASLTFCECVTSRTASFADLFVQFLAKIPVGGCQYLSSYLVNAVQSFSLCLISTDEHSGYRHLGREFNHGVVRHSAGEYVAGAVHTNTIEGFWSLIKRGLIGTYHKVSAKYLPLYVAEFQFRYNNRQNADIFNAALAGC